MSALLIHSLRPPIRTVVILSFYGRFSENQIFFVELHGKIFLSKLPWFKSAVVSRVHTCRANVYRVSDGGTEHVCICLHAYVTDADLPVCMQDTSSMF